MKTPIKKTCPECGKSRTQRQFRLPRAKHVVREGVVHRFIAHYQGERCIYCEKRRLLNATGWERQRILLYGKVPEVLMEGAAATRRRRFSEKMRAILIRRWTAHHKAERVQYVRPELNRMRAALRTSGQVSAALSGFYLHYIHALKALMKVRPTRPLSQEEHLDPLFDAARRAWAELTPEERGLRTPPRRLVLPPRKTRGEAIRQTLKDWLASQSSHADTTTTVKGGDGDSESQAGR